MTPDTARSAEIAPLSDRLAFMAALVQTRWDTQRGADDSARPALIVELPAREVDALITVLREAAEEHSRLGQGQSTSGWREVELSEAVRTILRGFDEGVFVRSVDRDGEPGWAIKLLPFIQALAVAQRALPSPPPSAGAPQS